jgi:hypothetical protein
VRRTPTVIDTHPLQVGSPVTTTSLLTLRPPARRDLALLLFLILVLGGHGMRTLSGFQESVLVRDDNVNVKKQNCRG